MAAQCNSHLVILLVQQLPFVDRPVQLEVLFINHLYLALLQPSPDVSSGASVGLSQASFDHN